MRPKRPRAPYAFLVSHFGADCGYQLHIATILGYLISSIRTNSFAFKRVSGVVVWIFIPLRLAWTRNIANPNALLVHPLRPSNAMMGNF